MQDVQRPHSRLPWLWPAILNVRLHERDTALRQVEALGFAARDVRHIVLTHLDFDHAGGVEDFPEARVHVLAIEREAADSQAAQLRRQPALSSSRNGMPFATGAPMPRTAILGLASTRCAQLDGLPPEILMVPLRGHTTGTPASRFNLGIGWLLHAGDAYLHHRRCDLSRHTCTPGLAIYQHIMDSDRRYRRINQERLRELKRGEGNIRVLCSHDAKEFAEFHAIPHRKHATSG